MTSNRNERKKTENYIKLLRVLHYNESEDTSKLKDILALRDINYKIPQNGLTTSHLIADTNEWSNSSFAEFLINHGADPTIANHEGQTAVHWIASKFVYNPGCLSMIQSISFLLTTIHVKNKNATNFKDIYGFSHFHAACMINNVQIIEFFINKGVSVDEAVKIDSPKYPGYTPLHFAVQYRYVELVNLLLNHGANLIKDSKGMSPLHMLVQKNMDIVQYSKLHRTLVGEFQERFYVCNVINEKELFSEIVETNKIMIRSILLKTSKTLMVGIDLFPFYVMRTFEDDDSSNWTLREINKCIPTDSICWPGYTAMHFATRFDIHIVKLLLEKGADIEVKDADGVTPLDVCIGRFGVEDIHSIISSHNVWRNILLSDSKTKLLDLVLAMGDRQNLTTFLSGIQQDINTITIPRNSPLWPGFTVLHLAVMLSKKGMRFRVASYVPLFYDHFTMKEDARLDVAKQTNYTVDQLIRKPDELIEVCLHSGADVIAQDSNSSTPIHLAFRRMDLECLYFLLERYKGHSNPTDKDNLSLLHIACALEKVTLVKQLIAGGADLNAMVSSSFQWDPELKYFHELSMDRQLHVWPGSTALHVALTTNFQNGRKVVKLLIKAGANLHAKDAFGLTPLHRLLKLGLNSKIVDDTLLSRFITRDCVVDGLSYLHVAALHKYPKTMKKLLDLGANVNSAIAVRDRTNENLSSDHYRRATCDRTTKFSYFMLYFEGNTPLHMALEHCYSEEDYEVAKILVFHGADVLAKNYEGISPLRKMLEEGGYGGLLKHCTDVISDDEEQRLIDKVGVTKLHMACRLCDDELVKNCLKDGIGVVDVQIRDEFGIWSGYTPLHLLVASFCHNLREPFDHERQTNRAMRLLLNHGADVMIVNAKGETPCLMDLWENHIEWRPSHMDILWKKLKKNGNVNRTSDEGISHFHLACIRNDVDMVERFLKLRVDPNQRTDYYLSDFRGYTPLHFAVCRKTRFLFPDKPALKTINLLLKYGADVHARNADNETPLYFAGKFRSPAAMPYKRMFWAGADPDVKSLFRGEVPHCPLFNVESGEVRRLLNSACLYGCYHLARGCYRWVVYHSRILRGTCGKCCKRSAERQLKRTKSEESVCSEEYDPDIYLILDI